MADVTLTYKGSTILSLEDSATKTIKTGGKFCEGDISVSYVKPSSGEVYAAISVTYPAGSVCTATNGTTTLTAADTSGQVVFGIPEPSNTPEMWSVSCVDNSAGDSVSSTVSVNSYGDNCIVTLTYYYDPIFGNNPWDAISRVSQRGLGDTYWDIGDKKEIILNGAIGSGLTLSNFSTYVFILDFNHRDGGVADNNIILGGFKTNTNVDICLCDNKYDTGSYSGIYFNINHVGTSGNQPNKNYGGWKGCDFRYDILGAVQTAPNSYNTNKSSSTTGSDATIAAITNPKANTLMAALPSDFRNVLRLHTHYANNKGGSSDSSDVVTSVVDAGIFLLAEYEIFGTIKWARQYEQDKQTQMTYYKNGASKIKYKHNATTTAVNWWESSASTANSTYFVCYVTYAGTEASYPSSRSYGLAPAFKI